MNKASETSRTILKDLTYTLITESQTKNNMGLKKIFEEIMANLMKIMAKLIKTKPTDLKRHFIRILNENQMCALKENFSPSTYQNHLQHY